jgi:hypothetical protein
MEKPPKKERRAGERRKGVDRRKGELDDIYKRLLDGGTVVDSRKGERRKGEGRSGLPRPTMEDRYVIYRIGMKKVNSEREKAGMEHLPVHSFGEWSKTARQKKKV